MQRDPIHSTNKITYSLTRLFLDLRISKSNGWGKKKSSQGLPLAGYHTIVCQGNSNKNKEAKSYYRKITVTCYSTAAKQLNLK
jgi:hypothetical protein